MTVTNTNSRVSQYNCNGSQTAFTFNWQVIKNTDNTHGLKVIRTTVATGATTTLVENTDYTVTLDGTSPSTGTVTISPALASTFRITIISNSVLKQEIDLQNSVQVDLPTIESGLDRTTLLIQDITNEKLQRAIVLAEDTTTRNVTFPAISSDNSEKVIRVNTAGTALEAKDIDELISLAAFNLNDLTATDTVDTAADYALIYDTSAASQRKVLVEDLVPPSNTAGQIKNINYTNKTDTSSLSLTSSDWTDVPGMSVTVTPSSITDVVKIGGTLCAQSSGGPHVMYRLLKNNTDVIWSSDNLHAVSPPAGMSHLHSGHPLPTILNFIDTYVGTTSSVTYKLQVRTVGTSFTLVINRDSTDSNAVGTKRFISQIYGIVFTGHITYINNNTGICGPLVFTTNKNKGVAVTTPTDGNSTLKYFREDLKASLLNNSAKILLQTSVCWQKSSGTITRLKQSLWCNEARIGVGDTAGSRDRVTAVRSDGTLELPSISYIHSPAAQGLYSYNLIIGGTASIVINPEDTSAGTVQSRSTFTGLIIDPLNFTHFKGSNSTEISDASTTVAVANESAFGSLGYSVTYTPTSASSYLLLTGMITASKTGAYSLCGIKFQRDGVDILTADTAGSRIPVSIPLYGSATSASTQTCAFDFIIPATAATSTTIEGLLNHGNGTSQTFTLNALTGADTDVIATARTTSQINIIELLPS